MAKEFLDIGQNIVSLEVVHSNKGYDVSPGEEYHVKSACPHVIVYTPEYVEGNITGKLTSLYINTSDLKRILFKIEEIENRVVTLVKGKYDEYDDLPF